MEGAPPPAPAEPGPAGASPKSAAEIMAAHLLEGTKLAAGFRPQSINPTQVLAKTKRSKVPIFFKNIPHIIGNAVKLEELQNRHEALMQWHDHAVDKWGDGHKEWKEKESKWRSSHDALVAKDNEWKKQSEEWHENHQKWQAEGELWRECCGLFIHRIMKGGLGHEELERYDHLVHNFRLQDRMGHGYTIPDRVHMMMTPLPQPASPQQQYYMSVPPIDLGTWVPTDAERAGMVNYFMHNGLHTMSPHEADARWGPEAIRYWSHHQAGPPHGIRP